MKVIKYVYGVCIVTLTIIQHHRKELYIVDQELGPMQFAQLTLRQKLT